VSYASKDDQEFRTRLQNLIYADREILHAIYNKREPMDALVIEKREAMDALFTYIDGIIDTVKRVTG